LRARTFNGKKLLFTPPSLLHLGFVTDTTVMTCSITDDKWSNVTAVLSSLTAAALQGDPVPVKSFAAVLGKLTAIRRSHGPIVPALSRHLQHTLGLHVNTIGWTGFVHLDSHCRHELQALLHDLLLYNHRPIPSVAQALHFAPQNPSLHIAAVSTAESLPPSYGLNITGTLITLPPLTSPSVLLKEVNAAAAYIIATFPHPAIPTTVIWPTSSKSFPHLVSHGSLSFVLNAAVIRLLRECRDRFLTFRPSWFAPPRPLLAASDATLQNSRSTDEWSVSCTDLKEVFTSASCLNWTVSLPA
jgi:hypothetical protein